MKWVVIALQTFVIIIVAPVQQLYRVAATAKDVGRKLLQDTSLLNEDRRTRLQLRLTWSVNKIIDEYLGTRYYIIILIAEPCL